MRLAGLLSGCVFLFVVCPAAASALPADLAGTTSDQHIVYPSRSAPGQWVPSMTVGNVGDVNGDGRDDIGAGFTGYAREDEAYIYVTFSSAQDSSGDVSDFDGFKIVTQDFGRGLSSAGDVNGDGLGDIAIMGGVTQATVVFGRTDGKTVDTRQLGDDGFTILHARQESGSSAINGVEPVGDINDDGVPDLLVSGGTWAGIVYPPHDAAGSTIDLRERGPHVGQITLDEDHRFVTLKLDVLGDVDGDGRPDVLFAGEEDDGTDQVAYGVSLPPPGDQITLPAAVQDGEAFSIRTHDGQVGAQGELEQATTLGDQNGDGVRDVVMITHCASVCTRRMRVVYTPQFGTAIDAENLVTSEPRGYAFFPYSSITDVGDQNGDGVADFASMNYVTFPDPPTESVSASGVPGHTNFDFQSGLVAVARLGDLNGDGRDEIVLQKVVLTDNEQHGTYEVAVYDSATDPDVSQPTVPVMGPAGLLSLDATVDAGSGSRGEGSVWALPTLEIAPLAGIPHPVANPGLIYGRRGLKLDISPGVGGTPLIAGHIYQLRLTAINGRGLKTDGPWRTFVYNPSNGTTGGLNSTAQRLSIHSKRLALRNGRLAVRLRCAPSVAHCRGTLKLSGAHRTLGSRRFDIAPDHIANVRVRVPAAARRALRHRRHLTVLARAKTTQDPTSPPYIVKAKLRARWR